MVTNILLANEGYTHKNWFYKDIFINYSMVYYIVDGVAHYRDSDGTHPLKAGNLYVFPSKKRFTLYDDPHNKLYHTYIHAVVVPAITEFIEFDVGASPVVADSIALLRKYIHSNNHHTISNILNLILENILDGNIAPDSIALQTKQYIDANLNEKITLDSICQNVLYSKGYILRSFKKIYNVSPMAYYNDQRLKLSVDYLLKNKSNKDISILINYPSPAAYCKAFKIKFGLPPKAYIESLLKIQDHNDDFKKSTRLKRPPPQRAN